MTAIRAEPMRRPSEEHPLAAREMRVIAQILHREAGIEIADAKVALVRSRLIKRLRALGLPDFDAYCRLIRSESGAAERGLMISALTTNVTRFFREPHHFADLREWLAGDLGARARRGERVRLWSAGCSSGEEPYSVALTVIEALPDAPSLDVRILATDIDPVMVGRATAGRYPASALTDVPQALRARHFEPDGEGGLVAGPALRRLVAVRPLNLVRPWPVRGPFDLILCRNVAIYFDAATQAEVWARFAAVLRPGGRLYIGHSERLSGPAMQALTLQGTTIYGLAEGAAADASAPRSGRPTFRPGAPAPDPSQKGDRRWH